MKKQIGILLADWYKIGHYKMMPKGTEMTLHTWTPRKSRIPAIKEVVMYGLQGFMKEYLWGLQGLRDDL